MNRSLLALGLVLLPSLALAQVAAPSSPTSTRAATTVVPPPAAPVASRPVPVVQPSPPAPPRQAAPAPVPRPVTAPPAEAGPIRSTGPAQVAPPRSTAPAKVYDRDGRIIPGVKPAGQNRVFDSRTGRYYDSVPQGSDSRIRP